MANKKVDDKGYRGPQAQGGISHEVAERARRDPHPERAGVTDGSWDRPEVKRSSMDRGGEPPEGFSGDDGGYDPGVADDTPQSPRNAARESSAGPGGDAPGAGEDGDDTEPRSGGHTRRDSSDFAAEQSAPTGDIENVQEGGTRLDREQRVEERKQRESGGGFSRSSADGRAAPSPGTPIRRP